VTPELRAALAPFLAAWDDAVRVAAHPAAPPELRHGVAHPELHPVHGLPVGTGLTFAHFRDLHAAAQAAGVGVT